MDKSLRHSFALSQALITVAAVSVGVLVANIYYAQPLLGPIAKSIGIAPALAGSLVSITQIGYGAGLFFLVPLADLVENRRLALVAAAVLAMALVGVAASQTAAVFFLASLGVGFCASSAQVLVPFVAHLGPPERRGQVVGTVMGGLLTGIMLSRPAALYLAGSFGWRVVFVCSSVLMFAIWVALARTMPRYRPRLGLHYSQVLASMLTILRERPAVRWRAIYQSLMFCAFNLFWTVVPLLLAQQFRLNEHQIALFALAGSGGALAAPIAGRLADRGYVAAATAGAMVVLSLSFAATVKMSGAGGLIGITIFAVLIDAAVQINQVVGQHVIFDVPGEIRGRVNAIYMTLVFIGGAAGSMLGTLVYHSGGWETTAACGAGIGLLAFVLNATERATGKG